MAWAGRVTSTLIWVAHTGQSRVYLVLPDLARLTLPTGATGATSRHIATLCLEHSSVYVITPAIFASSLLFRICMLMTSERLELDRKSCHHLISS